jgi:hypothetical protein
MAPGAISDSKAFRVTGHRENGRRYNCQDRYFRPDVLHDPNSTPCDFSSSTKQTELLQTTDIGGNGFHLLPVQAVSDRQHGG